MRCAWSLDPGRRSLYSHTVFNLSFHFREFFSYKFTLSMFLNEEVYYLLPSLETKGPKRIRKNFTAPPPRTDKLECNNLKSKSDLSSRLYRSLNQISDRSREQINGYWKCVTSSTTHCLALDTLFSVLLRKCYKTCGNYFYRAVESVNYIIFQEEAPRLVHVKPGTPAKSYNLCAP